MPATPLHVECLLQAAPRMSQQHLERMQKLRAAGIAKHGKSPALQVPRRAAADCQLQEGAYVRVGGLNVAVLGEQGRGCSQGVLMRSLQAHWVHCLGSQHVLQWLKRHTELAEQWLLQRRCNSGQLVQGYWRPPTRGPSSCNSFAS